jgi:hypothetical protein
MHLILSPFGNALLLNVKERLVLRCEIDFVLGVLSTALKAHFVAIKWYLSLPVSQIALSSEVGLLGWSWSAIDVEVGIEFLVRDTKGNVCAKEIMECISVLQAHFLNQLLSEVGLIGQRVLVGSCPLFIPWILRLRAVLYFLLILVSRWRRCTLVRLLLAPLFLLIHIFMNLEGLFHDPCFDISDGQSHTIREVDLKELLAFDLDPLDVIFCQLQDFDVQGPRLDKWLECLRHLVVICSIQPA